MIIKSLEEIFGYEYDWLACDCIGHVALLSTAGVGYAPLAYLSNIEAYDRAIESFLRLSSTTSAKTFPKITECLQNTWKHVAERGMYGYDSDSSGDYYKRVSVPLNPIFIDDLPPEIAAVSMRVKFISISFSEQEWISKPSIQETEGS